MLSKLLIFLIGEALFFPNALARNRRQTMQQVQIEFQNELQKKIPVFHFSKRANFKPRLSKPQQLSAIKNQRSSNKQATYNRQAAATFNTAGYKPINTVLNKNEFFDLYQQMFQEEW